MDGTRKSKKKQGMLAVMTCFSLCHYSLIFFNVSPFYPMNTVLHRNLPYKWLLPIGVQSTFYLERTIVLH